MNPNISKKFMARWSLLIISILLLCIVQPDIFAQTDTQVSKTYIVKLKDGGSITGTLISQDSETMVFETSSMGRVTIERSNIMKITALSSGDAVKGWFTNPNPGKYLLGNSAIPNEKNTGYYQNTWIFFHGVSYAFTDFFSLSGGIEIFSLLASGEGPFAFFINPKVSFEVADNLYFGGNILYINTLKSFEDFGGLGTLNAFGTYGNKNSNISAGVGWGFFEGDFSKKPVVTVSGMVRVSNRIAFITENWLVPADPYYGIFSYGIRFMGSNTSIDLAFVNNSDIAEALIIGIPYLDFVINF